MKWNEWKIIFCILHFVHYHFFHVIPLGTAPPSFSLTLPTRFSLFLNIPSPLSAFFFLYYHTPPSTISSSTHPTSLPTFFPTSPTFSLLFHKLFPFFL